MGRSVQSVVRRFIGLRLGVFIGDQTSPLNFKPPPERMKV
jgi:hypothetical protein